MALPPKPNPPVPKRNGLSEKREEVLFLLAEDLGEALAAIKRVVDDGYGRCDDKGVNNRNNLEISLGRVLGTITLLEAVGDINYEAVFAYRQQRVERTREYLRYVEEK